METTESKTLILQRILANKNGVQRDEVNVIDFSENTVGVTVHFSIDDRTDVETLTWWTIAVSA